jgi:aerobic carbon-monoxide dehydrogenase medium subunit
MKSAAFEYHRPTTLSEAISLMSEFNHGAQILAGGQSLIPMMSLRMSRPDHIVDINRIAQLSRLERKGPWLCVGSLVRHEVLERAPIAYEACPLLRKAANLIGDRQIRARGTIGGSLALSYPGAEWPTAVVAVDAHIVATSGEGERIIPADDFFLDVMSTALTPVEILTEIRIPAFDAEVRWAFEEYPFKPSGFAIASCALKLRLDVNDRCRDTRLVVGGAGPVPLRISEAETAIDGQPLSDALIDQVAEMAFRAVDPSGDAHASKEYRRTMARNCVRSALKSISKSHATDGQR